MPLRVWGEHNLFDFYVKQTVIHWRPYGIIRVPHMANFFFLNEYIAELYPYLLLEKINFHMCCEGFLRDRP